MKSITSIAVGVVVAAGLAQTCLYTVGEREYAMLFALGELKTVVTEPGLHFKLPAPLQNVVYLDKRILTLDASGADLVQTSEKKNLMIDTFVKWRIGDARRYWVSFQGSERAASDRLAMLLRDVLNIAVNKRTVNQITSSEREKAMAEISELLQARVKALGIDIVDVRMKRVDFTPEISESVYSRMEAERKRVASEERSKGAAQAERIRAGADRQSEVILAEAYRDAQKTKGEGDGEAARIYADAFGKMAYITKATAQLMRDLGSIQSPQNAFLLNLGLETLHLRMRQHCANAQAVAEYLEQNERVAWVNYCGLKSNKYYELGQKYLPNGSCGVIAFGLKGTKEDAIRFMDSLKMICIVTHVADARTCVLHPASHTHRQLSDEQLREAGVAPDLIRLSVGIENVEDIIEDIQQALDASK